MATNLFVVVVLGYDKKQAMELEKWYHVGVWGSAFVFWLVPLLTLNYGPAGLWYDATLALPSPPLFPLMSSRRLT